MIFGRLGGVLVALAVMGMSHAAYAKTWLVGCPGGATATTLAEVQNESTVAAADFPADSVAGISGQGVASGAPDALGALFGTPEQGSENLTTVTGLTFTTGSAFSASLVSGDTVEITGQCNQVVEVRTSGLNITGNTGSTTVGAEPPSSPPPDGDNNQVIVSGAQNVVFNALLFGSSTGTVNIAANTGFGFAGDGMLCVLNGAAITLENVQVENSSGRGIFAANTAAVTLLSTLVDNNGVGNTNQVNNTGIFAEDSSAIKIGSNTASPEPGNVQSNGGDGIRIETGSSLTMFAGTINNNGQKQVFLLGSSSGVIDATNTANQIMIQAPTVDTDNVIALEAGSSLLLEAGAVVAGTTTGTVIAALGSSTVLMQGSFVSGGVVTVEATGGSLIALAGGNNICNGTLTGPSTCTTNTALTDFAIEIDHVSALDDLGANITGFNFTPAADFIFGNGSIQLQSSADLGAGLIGGAGGTDTLFWTTGSTTGIGVAQSSSLRLEGGVNITGVIKLNQGSSGFVNIGKNPSGDFTRNTVSQGITCPFVQVPASHISVSNDNGLTFGSLNPTPLVATLGSSSPSVTTFAASFASATSPQCLQF